MAGEQERFDQALRSALYQLYSPAALRNSPLRGWLTTADDGNSAMYLQRTLLSAIESLRPQLTTPADSRAWRFYQILRRRYTEQLPQNQVALDLGLSTRQLQREEQAARRELAAYLWQQSSFAQQQAGPAGLAEETLEMPSRDQELAHLLASTPATAIDPAVWLADLLETVMPLAQSAHTHVRLTLAEAMPAVVVQATLLRQALLDMLTTAIHNCAGGTVEIKLTAQPQLQIEILGNSEAALAKREPMRNREQWSMAAELIQLCGGTLSDQTSNQTDDVAHDHFHAIIRLPVAKPATVLVIDDNADTQRLLQRYLLGSQYQFSGAADGQQGIALALELTPHAIVLDVMMPTEDGWSLLGRLREHPQTGHIPVIVCTILPQADLAHALGAAHFLRKPITRTALLGALGQVTSAFPDDGVN